MTTMAPALSFASAYRQLRPSEKAFVDGYVANTEREAGLRNERISNALHRPIPAHVIEASQGLLERPMVIAAIAERITQLAADSELTAQRVIKELMAIAFSNIGDYGDIQEDGQMRWDLTRCTPEQLAAVKKIKHEMDPRNPYVVRKVEIELHDKMGGLDRLCKYMGLLEPENPHWRAEQARPVTHALTADATVDVAADRYAAMINA